MKILSAFVVTTTSVAAQRPPSFLDVLHLGSGQTPSPRPPGCTPVESLDITGLTNCAEIIEDSVLGEKVPGALIEGCDPATAEESQCLLLDRETIRLARRARQARQNTSFESLFRPFESLLTSSSADDSIEVCCEVVSGRAPKDDSADDSEAVTAQAKEDLMDTPTEQRCERDCLLYSGQCHFCLCEPSTGDVVRCIENPTAPSSTCVELSAEPEKGVMETTLQRILKRTEDSLSRTFHQAFTSGGPSREQERASRQIQGLLSGSTENGGHCLIRVDETQSTPVPTSTPPGIEGLCSEGCIRVFDGCNTCTCGDDGAAICTKKACSPEQSLPPVCLDDGSGTTIAPPTQPPQDCAALICPAVYQPVCSNTGETFSNSCLLSVAQCYDTSIFLASDGACPGDEESTSSTVASAKNDAKD